MGLGEIDPQVRRYLFEVGRVAYEIRHGESPTRRALVGLINTELVELVEALGMDDLGELVLRSCGAVDALLALWIVSEVCETEGNGDDSAVQQVFPSGPVRPGDGGGAVRLRRLD